MIEYIKYRDYTIKINKMVNGVYVSSILINGEKMCETVHTTYNSSVLGAEQAIDNLLYIQESAKEVKNNLEVKANLAVYDWLRN